jgi:hypothetical protein
MSNIAKITANFILKYILGWKIKGAHNSYDNLRKDRHQLIYVRTSIFEVMIGFLMMIIYQIPVIILIDKSLTKIPLFGKIFRNKYFITFDNINQLEHCDKNFVFVTTPIINYPKEIDRKVNSFSIELFDQAVKTGSHIHMAHFDFEEQVVWIEEIATDIIVRLSPYQTIRNHIDELIKTEKTYYPIKDNKNYTGTNVRMINFKRSQIVHLMVLYIIVVTITVICKSIIR